MFSFDSYENVLPVKGSLEIGDKIHGGRCNQAKFSFTQLNNY